MRYLPLILHAVDGVWRAIWSTVPHQDVFKVPGLEFHVLKGTSCVLSSTSCRRQEQGEPVGLQTEDPFKESGPPFSSAASCLLGELRLPSMTSAI